MLTEKKIYLYFIFSWNLKIIISVETAMKISTSTFIVKSEMQHFRLLKYEKYHFKRKWIVSNWIGKICEQEIGIWNEGKNFHAIFNRIFLLNHTTQSENANTLLFASWNIKKKRKNFGTTENLWSNPVGYDIPQKRTKLWMVRFSVLSIFFYDWKKFKSVSSISYEKQNIILPQGIRK